MSQKFSVNKFQWIEETSQETSQLLKKVMKDIFLNLMFNTQKNYINFIKTYHFYQKERKLKKKIEKLVSNLYDKKEYIIHIRNLKQEINHGLILKKVDRVIKFNQKRLFKTLY